MAHRIRQPTRPAVAEESTPDATRQRSNPGWFDSGLRAVGGDMAAVKVVEGAEAARDEFWERYGRLTPREREVMELVTKGMATKEIARDLGLSPRTVEKHRIHIMAKMETGRLADLVRMAVQIEADAR